MTKLQHAFTLFDDYNKQDPNTIEQEGETFPAEYFYALRMHEWVIKLDAQASESLLLASRSQHIGRWKSPRQNYPMDKAGIINGAPTWLPFMLQLPAS